MTTRLMVYIPFRYGLDDIHNVQYPFPTNYKAYYDKAQAEMVAEALRKKHPEHSYCVHTYELFETAQPIP